MNKKQITISKQYPAYWEYGGEPLILLGGSKEDNLFQIPDLKEHLELLHSVGGNYIRCTMSSRDEGNIWPYKKVGDKYDLTQFSEEYWQKFSNLLRLTYEMDIIVQIEVWDRFDFARAPWLKNPFNPRNNMNYTAEESLLKETIDSHPNKNENRFFFSIPQEDHNQLLLKYQKAFVDKLLSYSLEYPHVLYCMDNETSAVESWGRYWSEYIKQKAAERGINVHTTEMWDAWSLTDEQHARTFDHPEIYSFCDISQNNHHDGDKHWNGLISVRNRMMFRERPLNNVKIYGSDDGSKFGAAQDAVERFWRCILGKAASARFHRPPAGIGLSQKAQRNLKSMRMFLEKINIFECLPNNDLLLNRKENITYCTAVPNREIAVFFCREGEVIVDTSAINGNICVEWLDIDYCKWIERKRIPKTDRVLLQTITEGVQVALIKKI